MTNCYNIITVYIYIYIIIIRIRNEIWSMVKLEEDIENTTTLLVRIVVYSCYSYC